MGWLQKVGMASALGLFLVVMLVIKLHAAPTVTAFHWAIVFLPWWIAQFIWLLWLGYMTLLFSGMTSVKLKLVQPPEKLAIIVSSIAWAGFLAFGIELAIELQTPGTIDIRLLFLPLIIALSLIILVAWSPYAYHGWKQKFLQKYEGPARTTQGMMYYAPMSQPPMGVPLGAAMAQANLADVIHTS